MRIYHDKWLIMEHSTVLANQLKCLMNCAQYDQTETIKKSKWYSRILI